MSQDLPFFSFSKQVQTRGEVWRLGDCFSDILHNCFAIVTAKFFMIFLFRENDFLVRVTFPSYHKSHPTMNFASWPLSPLSRYLLHPWLLRLSSLFSSSFRASLLIRCKLHVDVGGRGNFTVLNTSCLWLQTSFSSCFLSFHSFYNASQYDEHPLPIITAFPKQRPSTCLYFQSIQLEVVILKYPHTRKVLFTWHSFILLVSLLCIFLAHTDFHPFPLLFFYMRIFDLGAHFLLAFQEKSSLVCKTSVLANSSSGIGRGNYICSHGNHLLLYQLKISSSISNILWRVEIGKITCKVIPRGITPENSEIPGETMSLVPAPNVSLP